ncbi:MAG: hypothetical protein WAP34_08140 [Desulfomonilia bacterium]
MVLKSRPTDQGIRFIVGAGIIALSIYGFYLALAGQNSPELFLVPETVALEGRPCTDVLSPSFSLCVPSGLQYTISTDGAIVLRSAEAKMRGEVKLLEKLPREEEWRASLRNPLIRTFLGDERGLSTQELMMRILSHRYNPTLMGVKAQLIPSWMKKTRNSEILIPSGADAILFYTPAHLLGFAFAEGKIVMLSCAGSMDKAAALSIIGSIRVTSPEGQETGSLHSS